jgi:RNA polymerase sigma-54 factor
MRIEAQLTAAPMLAMQPTPALILFAELLVMAAPDLEERVDQELATNPALDRDPAGVCPACGDGATACRCAAAARLAERRPAAEGGADLLEQLAYRRTLPERLLDDLRPSLAAADRPIAEYLAYSLDDRGRLTEPPGDAAAALGVPIARVEAVLALLRRAGPPGIAARDGRECLLLQLDRWEEEHPPERLVRRILEDHLESLAAGRLGAIAGATGAGAVEVLAAREFIRARLRPYPPCEVEDDGVARPGETPGVLPDVRIVETPDRSGGFQVQLLEPLRLGLMVDPLYEALAATGSAAPDGAKSHARAHVQHAREFLSRLEQRWRTLRLVVEYLVQRQEAFLRRGPRYLEPLTRAEVAAAIGLHESTVSRAVAGKYAALPSGGVVPISRFFDGSLAFRELLRRLIAAETRPLSDAELARALAARGHTVARRTVAKYRALLGIPACSAR